MKTLEEYNEALKTLEIAFNEKKAELAKSYVFANAKYKIGDIIKENRWIIKIESIRHDFDYKNNPIAVYKGIELKTNLTPKKGDVKQEIWQDEDTIKFPNCLVKSA